MQKQERIMSGMRPTGKLHLGHYMGVLKNWLSLQDDYECFFAIADWHALTTKFDDTSTLKQNIVDVALDWLACGINPDKSTIYVQSLVPETAELHLLLSMITPQNWVERDTTLKDMIKILEEKGLFQKIGILLTKSGPLIKKARKEENAYERKFIFDQLTILYGEMNILFNKIKSEEIKKFKTQLSSIQQNIEFLLKQNEQNIEEIEYSSFETSIKVFKNNIEKEIEEAQSDSALISYGLLGYPVLQTADIIQFNASLVPVGKDQLAHLEISRDIVRRFNHLYKTSLIKEPQPKLTETPLLKGIDGQKMGKSFNNDIKISDSEEITTKKIMQAITDRNRIKKTDPGNPENCEVICPYYEIFADEETVKKQRYNCENALWGCADCKRELASIINSQFKDIREKRLELEKNPEYVHEIIQAGSLKAKDEAALFLKEIKKAMQLY